MVHLDTNNSLFYLAHIIGIVLCCITPLWLLKYQGGFGIRTGNPVQQVNVHIALCVPSIYICALGILIFRGKSSRLLKILHAVSGGIVIVFLTLGLIAEFDVKQSLKISHLQTIHSLMGIIVYILFLAQWIFSFIAYMYPKLNLSFRLSFLPLHVFFGLTIFCLLGVVLELGLAETGSRDIYANYFMKSIFLLIVFFVVFVIFIAVRKSFKKVGMVNGEQEREVF